ncbi:TIGR03759 family integrating conjugative element protein [Pseudomonas gingeri]|uniref:TIGR03759 family integrating conjugative element protein n=1 Tax=Pseudomonas gingeri TaxID=117681 RepID=A0A7Y7YFD2_9PSED|nr:TIGR03759 family integrating conjugative element protein [Pseudomonas gingeri]NWA02315.1 TIGR03759 family integrating conjugative element protein [Pseudomonas gingeri]NWA12512.1 TIGR03759 family integrating conjugative element protein [Pseudomonas gingeri]NWA57082.1 TIGR03759 family integrating conjugative element protein [Pseudomonas gingeri]NWA93425.1 TIGR03759 family integrating conjugative element protein [Pseudomonas gingeri]NWB02897.1 TIGR03759 family integrating conjugative element p
MNMKIFRTVLSTACLLPAVTQAETRVQQAVENHRHQQSQVRQQELERAADWGLRQEEWQRYRRVMEGPLGIYSPNLDPLTALGIEARDSAEQQRYAELQVQAEVARVQKLMAYQNAYDQAYKRLYPEQLPVNLIGTHPPPMMSTVVPAGRLAVFVTTDCRGCVEQVRQLQRDKQGFDLYLVGSQGNDELIRDWARKAGIEPHKVRQREITLNHDDGHWQHQGDKGTFPAIMQADNGRWQRR